MTDLLINRVYKALGLKKKIVGLKFLTNSFEYKQSIALELKHSTICSAVQEARNGNYVKCQSSSLLCKTGKYLTGIQNLEEFKCQNKNYTNGKYKSTEISRKIKENSQPINHTIFGIEFYPLTDKNNTDMCIIICTSKDTMRIMQGYAKYYGIPDNLICISTYGVCSELISKPFMNNDINISLLSRCSRKFGHYSDDEMGISFPINMASNIFNGILETVNLTENNGPKKVILKRLNKPNDLGFEIIMNYDYAIKASEYLKYIDENLEKGGLE